LVNLVEFGPVQSIWNANNTKILKFQQELRHRGLNEDKVVTAPDKNILSNKVQMQIANWNSKWDSLCEKKHIEDMKRATSDEAIAITRAAEKELLETENILLNALCVNNAIDWELLKDKKAFSVPFPSKPPVVSFAPLPPVPNRINPDFQPKFSAFSKISKSSKQKAIEKAERAYIAAYDNWNKAYNDATQYNVQQNAVYTKNTDKFNMMTAEWNTRKEQYLKNQNESNAKIDNMKAQYNSFDVSTILEYCKMVLNHSVLPNFIRKEFDLEYIPNTKILIIDYSLPDIDDLPRLKEAKYMSTNNEIKKVYQNDAFMEKLYDSTIYKLILRVLHEEFEADIINAIEAISFNGWVNFLDKATGKREDACIASIQVKKEAFSAINLNSVDPKACFKSLKGIGSSKLAGITPIQPILAINKNDKRFVASHDVTNTFDDSTNLAAIPWEEFEHLIREVFEAEFSTTGGEVKVTQASRDGGVDAVAFDPDPIRGGKIVIQAKRYTNTVGVSAVRDLYGTVMNEGAIKGILVTTADYGPDAYAFAENKPLTLLNGGHLLHLLEKQGHKAKIDLREAKALNLANGY